MPTASYPGYGTATRYGVANSKERFSARVAIAGVANPTRGRAAFDAEAVTDKRLAATYRTPVGGQSRGWQPGSDGEAARESTEGFLFLATLLPARNYNTAT